MYIIGDVHGCLKTLLALIKKLPTDEEIILTGDLIDRGPSSKEVVQWVMDNSDRCRSVVGNHEQMLLNAHKEPDINNMDIWTWNGGIATLDSYFPETIKKNVFYRIDEDEHNYLARLNELKQARNRIDIPQDHLDFFESMPQYIKEGDLFISHTSWNMRIPFENVIKLDDSKGYFKGLTWFRGTPGRLPDNMFHVFGHTPISKPEITDYYADIDTGACFVGSIGYGKLTALHYPSMQIYQQENLDFPDVIKLSSGKN